MVSLKHNFVSPKADGGVTGEVKPTHWNAEHKFETSTDNVYLGRALGEGPGPVTEIPITNQLPPGMIMVWPAEVAPDGWYICDGSTKAKSGDELLFDVLGNDFGGTPGSTFVLPNLRGRVVAMFDPSATILTTGNTIRSVIGTDAVTLNDTQIPSHTHTVNITDLGHFHNVQLPQVANTTTGGSGGYATGGPLGTSAPAVDSASKVTGITATAAAVGGGQSHYNVQPTLVLNYVIKR